MEFMAFQKVKEEFEKSDVDKKIQIYVNTEGLTKDQYKELLRSYPLEELNRLEEALS